MMVFADDTKLWVQSSTETDALPLQTDLDKLCDWSRNWLLQFNQLSVKWRILGIN